MWSAVERLQQKTIFSTPASLVNAFTSVSCGCSVIDVYKRQELKRMMETPLPDPMMVLARRTFIFSSLTGLAYADTRALHPRHIGTTSEGRRYIRIRRAKTCLLYTSRCV